MDTPPATFQALNPTDVPLLRGLLPVFGAAFGEPETYGDAVPDDAYLADLLAKDHFVAIVARVGGAVVGGLAAYILDKFERKRSEVYIYDLAVAEAYRRQGIATGLIARLREIAAARGAGVIFVQAEYGDDPAIALYTGLGTREDVLHFDIAVPA